MVMFNPQGKKFAFKMSDCYEANGKGKCPIKDKDITIDCNCNRILKYLEKTNYVQTSEKIEINKNSCGHYTCSSGQHRICIVGNLNKSIEVQNISDTNKEEDSCCYCNKLEKLVESDIKIFVKEF